MGGFGMLQNGTFLQNPYAYLIIGLINTLHYEVYKGIFFGLGISQDVQTEVC